MKLYVWKIDGWDCYCRYSVVAESLEEAREIVVHGLVKNKEKRCILCFGLEESGDEQNMDFDEKRERMSQLWKRGNYVIRNWIRDVEPMIFEEKKLIIG